MDDGKVIYMKILNRLKRTRGFTLVELVVVVAIIGVLAALLIPTLASHIDNSHETSCMMDCRHFITAAQNSITKRYTENTLREVTANAAADPTAFIIECFVLAELDENGAIPPKYHAQMTITSGGDITNAIFTNGVYTITYDNGSYTAERGSLIDSSSLTVI